MELIRSRIEDCDEKRLERPSAVPAGAAAACSTEKEQTEDKIDSEMSQLPEHSVQSLELMQRKTWE